MHLWPRMNETIQKTQEDELTQEEVISYLELYLGKADWKAALTKVYRQVRKRCRDNEVNTKAQFREVVSCGILLPLVDGTRVPIDDPTKVLMWAQSQSNLAAHEWYELLNQERAKDKTIQAIRHKIATLGIIHPIAYSPPTRQAFNWIHAKAIEVGHLTPQNSNVVEKKFNNLVSIYGGNIICELFSRHSTARPILNKVVNWYSGYFIERLIHDSFTLDEIVAIKKNELNKTNKDLVKKI